MKRKTIRLLLLCLLVFSSRLMGAEERDDLFETKIRPVLVNTCLRCHGALKSSAMLRVDSRDALLKGGDSGPAIIPGKPDESLLVRAIQRQDDVSAMPPEKDKALRPDQVAAFVAWVKDGAVWPAKTARFEVAAHWAFQPIRDVPLPEIHDKAWTKDSIDYFIRAKQEAADASPARSATSAR